MGNLETGIKNEGVLVTKFCEICNVSFETKEGVITIKGSRPPDKMCKDCNRDSLRNHMNNIDWRSLENDLRKHGQ